jgi:hypothetical protein
MKAEEREPANCPSVRQAMRRTSTLGSVNPLYNYTKSKLKMKTCIEFVKESRLSLKKTKTNNRNQKTKNRRMKRGCVCACEKYIRDELFGVFNEYITTSTSKNCECTECCFTL